MRDDRTLAEVAADGQRSADRHLAELQARFRDALDRDRSVGTSTQKQTSNVEKCVQPGDWLNSLTSAERKKIPLGTVMREYFPDALALVAYHSWCGNEKHNPGEKLHWARGKSMDQEDCIARHLIGAGGRDPEDGLRHSAGLAWRALALLQLEIEKAYAAGEDVL